MVETRGRKALAPENRKPPQATVKINPVILPFVQELKGYLKNKCLTSEIIEKLFGVLQGSETDNEISLKFIQKYDREHLKVVELEGKNRSLQSTLLNIKAQLRASESQEYDCQFLTHSGKRCTRSAKVKKRHHGIEINVCLQHDKKLP